MLVTPLPGIDRQQLTAVLSEVGRSVGNLRGGAPGQDAGWVVAYLRWVNDAARSLHAQISAADVERLVLTRRYEHLLAGSSHGPQVLNGLLAVELDERVEAFDEASRALRAVIERWSRPGVFVVADTSVYIEHPDKVDELDLAPLIGARGDDVHLLVPIVVVDELDGLKKSSNNDTRRRARQALAVLDHVLAHPTTVARLREADFSALNSGGIPRGEVTVELVLDPPGHARLSINDDELVDRVLAIQPLAGRPIKLLTYDTGQSTRARAAGLDAIKLRHERDRPPRGQEPHPR